MRKMIEPACCAQLCHAAWPCFLLGVGLSVFSPLLCVLTMSVPDLILLVFWFKCVTFLGTLRWPAAGADMGGRCGLSCGDVFFSELWAGERLVLEKALPRYQRPGRPISVSPVPGGLGWSLPCRIGTNHCRLRHNGCEKCGHGLTSWPRETSSVASL